MEIEIADELWISFQYVSIFWRSYHLFLWLISPILWTLVFVKLFLISVNTSSRIGDYLIEASLPVYLIHHPLSLVYAFFVIDLEYSIYLKFFGHVIFVLILSFLVHEYMIRRVGFLRIIFGLKN
jgi:glucan biosynthesis protein C